MGSEASRDGGAVTPLPIKIVIAGGFGVGKTTTVASISEIDPLTTEARMTETAAAVDDAALLPEKSTTTVAMDFGRITLSADLRLYLFGTPGQSRFGFMWDDVANGAIGALVVVDSRRLDDCYPALDFVEDRGLPFVVGVNQFGGGMAHDVESIRWALAVADDTPLLLFDARDRGSVRDALIAVAETAMRRLTAAR